MKVINYQKELEKIIDKIREDGECPSLLLHVCCAPCSSYVLEYLSEYFRITVFFCNPNIYPKEEYTKRADEVKRLISELPVRNKVEFIEEEYRPEEFFDAVKGFEHIKEGGERCFRCFRLRLSKAAAAAARLNADYFTTTLSISPLKNAAKLNEIGSEESEKAGVKYLPSDFKKKNGYKRSIELSREYGLYRQNFCGCIFSKNERDTSK